jgi:hypothetical protein
LIFLAKPFEVKDSVWSSIAELYRQIER